MDIVSNEENDIYSYLRAFKTNHLLTYNTIFYATLRDVFELDNSYAEPIKNKADTYIPGGYVEKEISYYKTQEFTKKKIVLKKKQLKAFERNLSLLKENQLR